MISVIIPFHNEEENLPILLPHLLKELEGKIKEHEIILVDDGSTDAYEKWAQSFIAEKNIHLVKLNRQMGKGKALIAGIEKSQGDILVFMDADLQDDPGDISLFLEKLNQGYDLVNGYRHNRKDNIIVKIYSKLAGWFLKTFLNSPFSDINCGYKAFRRKVLDQVVIYGNNFRFFPLAAFYEGYRVSEVKVNNKPRIHGKSKFGISKLFIGVIDTFSAYFIYKFAEQPLHFFGTIGGVFFMLGGIILAILTYQRIFMNILLYRRPAFIYAIFITIVGLQIIMTGVIGELMVYVNKKRN